MSQYFQAGGEVLWNPSNEVAQLFLRSAQAMSPIVDLPTGIGAMISDECEIDMDIFTAFVNALVQRYQRSTHPILRSLMEGFVLTAVVMVERGGGGARAPDTETDPEVSDVAVTYSGLGARADQTTLVRLCADHARAMPR